MKRLLVFLAISLALTGCSGGVQNVNMRVARDNTFTGRGNFNERLLDITLEPQGQCRLRSVTVALDADDGDVYALHATVEGKIVGSAKVREGRREYTMRLRGDYSSPVTVTVGADIAGDAREGGRVSADLVSLSAKGAKYTCEAPAPGSREILLARSCLFMPGDYGSKYYRIPAICTLPDGSLLAVNDKRKNNEGDLPEDIDIVARRSFDNGRTWSEPVTVIEGHGYGAGYGDPVIVVAPDSTVICGFCGGPGVFQATPENPHRVYISTSSDFGDTWTYPKELSSLLYGPESPNKECRSLCSAFFGSGHGLVLEKEPFTGRVMFVAAVLMEDRRFCNYAVWSDDCGGTWNVSRRAFRDGDEAKVVELSDGKILMSVRQVGDRGKVISGDGGYSWGEQSAWTDVCVTNCDGDIIACPDGTLLQSLPNAMERRNVSIFISDDQGETWPVAKTICPYESAYSSITLLNDGTVGAYVEEYSTGSAQLWYMNFSTDWLRK